MLKTLHRKGHGSISGWYIQKQICSNKRAHQCTYRTPPVPIPPFLCRKRRAFQSTNTGGRAKRRMSRQKPAPHPHKIQHKRSIVSLKTPGGDVNALQSRDLKVRCVGPKNDEAIETTFSKLTNAACRQRSSRRTNVSLRSCTVPLLNVHHLQPRPPGSVANRNSQTPRPTHCINAFRRKSSSHATRSLR